MGRLSGRDIARAREIEDVLARVGFERDREASLDSAVSAMAETIGARAAVLYSLEPRGVGLRVQQFHAHGFPRGFLPLFNEYLADKTVGWSAFNPLSPEPSQRNLVINWAPLRRGREHARSATERDLYPRAGFGGWGTTRVVVCDGPQMLAYVGLFDPGTADARTEQILRRLIPAIQARMRVEHLLLRPALHEATLDQILEELGTAACIANQQGHVLAANTLARDLIARDARDFRDRLRSAIRSRHAGVAFRIVDIAARGSQPLYLALDRHLARDANARALWNAARIGFSPKQTRVAVLVAQGFSNRAIALRLSIAERTVEAHVTAMFDMSGVASRAALVAILMT